MRNCHFAHQDSILLYNTVILCICACQSWQWACTQWTSWPVDCLGQVQLGCCIDQGHV